MGWQIGCYVYVDICRQGAPTARKQGAYANVATGRASQVTANEGARDGASMGEMTNVYDVLVNRKKPIGRITLTL